MSVGSDRIVVRVGGVSGNSFWKSAVVVTGSAVKKRFAKMAASFENQNAGWFSAIQCLIFQFAIRTLFVTSGTIVFISSILSTQVIAFSDWFGLLLLLLAVFFHPADFNFRSPVRIHPVLLRLIVRGLCGLIGVLICLFLLFLLNPVYHLRGGNQTLLVYDFELSAGTLPSDITPMVSEKEKTIVYSGANTSAGGVASADVCVTPYPEITVANVNVVGHVNVTRIVKKDETTSVETAGGLEGAMVSDIPTGSTPMVGNKKKTIVYLGANISAGGVTSADVRVTPHPEITVVNVNVLGHVSVTRNVKKNGKTSVVTAVGLEGAMVSDTSTGFTPMVGNKKKTIVYLGANTSAGGVASADVRVTPCPEITAANVNVLGHASVTRNVKKDETTSVETAGGPEGIMVSDIPSGSTTMVGDKKKTIVYLGANTSAGGVASADVRVTPHPEITVVT